RRYVRHWHRFELIPDWPTGTQSPEMHSKTRREIERSLGRALPYPREPVRRLGRHTNLSLSAETLDLEFHHIACSQISWRLHPQPHSRRSSSRNQVSRFQSHKLRDVIDKIPRPEDHCPCVAILANFAVDPQLHPRTHNFGNLVRGRQPGSQGI